MTATSLTIDEEISSELGDLTLKMGLKSKKDSLPYLLAFFYAETKNLHRKGYMDRFNKSYSEDIAQNGIRDGNISIYPSLAFFRKDYLDYNYVSLLRKENISLTNLIQNTKEYCDE